MTGLRSTLKIVNAHCSGVFNGVSRGNWSRAKDHTGMWATSSLGWGGWNEREKRIMLEA